MDSQLLLIKAIRSGKLADVQAVLDSGGSVALDEPGGTPGLPMGVACFMGFVDIVRELAQRGAKVDFPDNSEPTSPLSMAKRGNRTEVVRALIELGALVPEGMQVGLTEHEIMLAQWKAVRDGHTHQQVVAEDGPVIEEINARGCFGTDTMVLEAEVMRAATKSNS
jgi:ankyrin repeat protein